MTTPRWSRLSPITIIVLSLAGATVLAPSLPATTIPGIQAQEPQAGLEETLQQLANLSQLYRDTALRFTADETIVDIRYAKERNQWGIIWWPRPMRETYKFRYFYIFAIPTDGSSVERLDDYRNVLDEKPADGNLQEVDLRELDLPAYITRAYSWVFLFQESLQKRFRYEFVGQQKALGRKAAMISFEPLPPFEKGLNEWFGKAWVDLETAQLLKVESIHQRHQATMGRLEESENTDELPSDTLVVHLLTEFGEEKNGMRFPSKVNIVGTEYWTPEPTRTVAQLELNNPLWATASIVFRVNQTYKNYRFFSVRTEEEIRRISTDTEPER